MEFENIKAIQREELVKMERREFSFVVADDHLRLISEWNMCEIMQVETRNFTEQELGSVLVRALKLQCVRSDAEQVAAAIDNVVSAINDVPTQLLENEECPDSVWTIIDKFAEAVRKNEREEGEDYRDYLKARDELANAMR